MKLMFLITAGVFLLTACASSIEVKAPFVPRIYPEELKAGLRIRIGQFEGANCLPQHVQNYLVESGKFTVVSGVTDTDTDLGVSGKLHRIAVYSNVFDKQVLVGWYTAFIITAPLAAVSYFGTGWRADAVATGEITATDGRTGQTIWTGAETIVVGEEARSLPSEDAVAKAMADLACRNLATKLLNRLLDSLVKAP